MKNWKQRSQVGGFRTRLLGLTGLVMLVLSSMASAGSAQPYRILVLGDEFSHQKIASYSNHWVTRLQARLTKENFSFEIINVSSSDLSSHRMRQKVDQAMTSHRPDLVVVQTGTFDDVFGYTEVFTDDNLAGILQSVARAGADALTVSITMPESMRVRKNNNHSERFRKIAASHQAQFAEMNLTKLDRLYDLSASDKAFVVEATQKKLMQAIWQTFEANFTKDLPLKKAG